MEIDVRDLGLDCRQTTYGGAVVSDTRTSLQTDGGSFLVETGTGIALGNIYEWTSYSTLRGANCVTITFVLHSANPGSTPPRPPHLTKPPNRPSSTNCSAPTAPAPTEAAHLRSRCEAASSSHRECPRHESQARRRTHP